MARAAHHESRESVPGVVVALKRGAEGLAGAAELIAGEVVVRQRDLEDGAAGRGDRADLGAPELLVHAHRVHVEFDARVVVQA